MAASKRMALAPIDSVTGRGPNQKAMTYTNKPSRHGPHGSELLAVSDIMAKESHFLNRVPSSGSSKAASIHGAGPIRRVSAVSTDVSFIYEVITPVG